MAETSDSENLGIAWAEATFKGNQRLWSRDLKWNLKGCPKREMLGQTV